MNLIKKCSFSTIAILTLFLITTFVFLLNSPLHPWIGGETGTDSSVFKTVALMMDKGYMPYRDSFDHKGPYLYILNWLGNRIAYYKGVWIIEFISFFCSLAAIYKIARLSCNRFFSCVTVFTSVSLLFRYFEGGNMTEEYAMPLIAVSQLIFLDYLINKNVTKLRLMLCGFCFGATCLLRANMIVLWIVYGSVIFVLCIVHKQYNDIKKFLLFFLLGACLIVIPIILWLGINGALIDFWDNYITFNREYTSASGGRASFTNKWTAFFTFTNNTIIILAILLSVYFCIIQDKILWGCHLCYLFLSLLFLSMSGMIFMHYGMVLVPAVSFPIATLFDILNSKKVSAPPKEKEHLAYIVAVFLIGIIVIPNWLNLYTTLASKYEDRGKPHLSQTVYVISTYIKNNTLEDDTISVYGNWNIIYLLSNRIHATKYSYQSPLFHVRPSIKSEYLEDLGKELPKIIVVQANRYDSDISQFLDQNGYSLIWSEDDSLEKALMFERTNSVQ